MLHVAAATSEADVEMALTLLLDAGRLVFLSFSRNLWGDLMARRIHSNRQPEEITTVRKWILSGVTAKRGRADAPHLPG